MDTGSSPSSFTAKDEVEGIEVAEFDANAPWELLHDEEEAASDAGVPTEANGPKPAIVIESYWCLYDFNSNNNQNIVEEFDWFHIVECNDMGGWCMEEEMNQILEIGDFTISQSEIPCEVEEIGYIGLWLDN